MSFLAPSMPAPPPPPPPPPNPPLLGSAGPQTALAAQQAAAAAASGKGFSGTLETSAQGAKTPDTAKKNLGTGDETLGAPAS